MVVLAGCASRGTITVTQPDGTLIEVQQPSTATAPATVAVADGVLTVSTGNQQPQTPGMIVAGKAWISYAIGGLIILAGVGLLVCKAWLPLIPTSAGTYTMLAGGAVIVLATVSVSIPWWAWMIAAGAGAVIILPGAWANKRAINSGAPAAGDTP